MRELRLFVPTYNFKLYPEAVERDEMDEFGNPYVPVLIQEAEGVRLALGSHDSENLEVPDIQVERQPNGWMIFLHPLGGSDPCGYVYFHDDGRSFLQIEQAIGPTLAIEILKRGAKVPDFDEQ